MKRAIRIAIIALISYGLFFAVALSGFTLLHHKTYNYRIVYHTVKEGQTWWGICGKYFYEQNRYGRNDFGEYVYETIKLNNAKNKHIYPGQIVKVKIETEVK